LWSARTAARWRRRRARVSVKVLRLSDKIWGVSGIASIGGREPGGQLSGHRNQDRASQSLSNKSSVLAYEA